MPLLAPIKDFFTRFNTCKNVLIFLDCLYRSAVQILVNFYLKSTSDNKHFRKVLRFSNHHRIVDDKKAYWEQEIKTLILLIKTILD